MSDPVPPPAPDPKQSSLAYLVAFPIDILIVYTFALHVSGSLVSRWFAWIAPLLQNSTGIRPADWYLQHLELVTIVPALVAGYINVGRFVPAIIGRPVNENRSASAAIWAWTVPTIILIYKMLRYHPPSSVLFDSSMSAFRYFLEIQTVMPTFANMYSGDVARVAMQMTVTAPFYAGVAYSLGALAARHQVLVKLFSFERQEQTSPSGGDDQT
jgi:hypothetical protein